jgi:hypothetical protein
MAGIQSGLSLNNNETDSYLQEGSEKELEGTTLCLEVAHRGSTQLQPDRAQEYGRDYIKRSRRRKRENRFEGVPR